MPTIAAALVSALFLHGSPARYSSLTDPDSVRSVDLSLGVALDRALHAIGSDRTALDAVQRAVRVGVSARSEDVRDERHADRVCATLRSRWAARLASRTARAAQVSL